MGHVCRAPGLCGLQKMPTEGKFICTESEQLSLGQGTSLIISFPLDCMLAFTPLDFGAWMTVNAC